MPESPHRLYTIKVVFINLHCVLCRWVASFTMSVIPSMARAQLYCVEQTFPFYWRMWDGDAPLRQSQWFQEELRGGCKGPGSCTLMLCNHEDSVVGSISDKCSPSPWGQSWAVRQGCEDTNSHTNADMRCRSSFGGWRRWGSSCPGWVFSWPPPQPWVTAQGSPSCTPDRAALGGDCSWTLLRKTSLGMLSAASSVMQSGSLQLGSKVSWIWAKPFIGAQ